MTVDVRNMAAVQKVARLATDHLEATGMFAEHVARLVRDRYVLVVSPDIGRGVMRAAGFRDRLSSGTSSREGQARPVGVDSAAT